MKALAWRLWWRVLCVLLVPVQCLVCWSIWLMRHLSRAADDAELEMLLATVEQRIAAKRRRDRRAGGQERP